MLFNNSIKGNRLLEGTLRDYLINFFCPQMPEREIALYRLPQFDPSLKNSVNRDPRLDEIVPETSASRACLHDPAILGNAILTDRFDLSPTLDAYRKLSAQAHFDNSFEYREVHARNNDIAGLLYVREHGCLPESDSSVRFSWAAGFGDTQKALSTAGTDEQKQMVKQVARQRAGEMLANDYPNIRTVERVPQMQKTPRHVPSVKQENKGPGQRL